MKVMVAHNYGEDTFHVYPGDHDYRELLELDVIQVIEGPWVYVKLSESGDCKFTYQASGEGMVYIILKCFPDNSASIPLTSILEYIEDIVGSGLDFVSKT